MPPRAGRCPGAAPAAPRLHIPTQGASAPFRMRVPAGTARHCKAEGKGSGAGDAGRGFLELDKGLWLFPGSWAMSPAWAPREPRVPHPKKARIWASPAPGRVSPGFPKRQQNPGNHPVPIASLLLHPRDLLLLFHHRSSSPLGFLLAPALSKAPQEAHSAPLAPEQGNLPGRDWQLRVPPGLAEQGTRPLAPPAAPVPPRAGESIFPPLGQPELPLAGEGIALCL